MLVHSVRLNERYSVETIVEEPGSDLWYWNTFKESKEGAEWNIGPTHSYIATVCDIDNKQEEPKNWLRTKFVDIKNATRLDIEVIYTLRYCHSINLGPFCRTSFSLYSYHTNDKLDPAPDPTRVKFHKDAVITPKTLHHASYSLTTDTFNGSVITKANGIYLALLDQGTCSTIRKVVVRYHYCSERSTTLVKFPRTVAPANDVNLTKQEGECTHPNSLQTDKKKLFDLWLSNGEWNITSNSACLCNSGYELTNGSSDSWAYVKV